MRLAGKIDWEFIDGEITPPYSAKGRPGAGDEVCDRPSVAQEHLWPVREAYAESMARISIPSLAREFYAE